MAKSTKPEKVKKNNNNIRTDKPKKSIGKTIAKLWELVLTLAELVVVYLLATQDNKILFIPAGILGLDASIRLVRNFVFNK